MTAEQALALLRRDDVSDQTRKDVCLVLCGPRKRGFQQARKRLAVVISDLRRQGKP